jgi:hypothetical protein
MVDHYFYILIYLSLVGTEVGEEGQEIEDKVQRIAQGVRR